MMITVGLNSLDSPYGLCIFGIPLPTPACFVNLQMFFEFVLLCLVLYFVNPACFVDLPLFFLFVSSVVFCKCDMKIFDCSLTT